MAMSRGPEVPEGLTREEQERIWRERRMEPFQDDPEMLEAIRTTPFDYESTPEHNQTHRGLGGSRMTSASPGSAGTARRSR